MTSLLLLFLFLLYLPFSEPSLSSDRLALLSLHSHFRLYSFNWTDQTSPCTWQGVECSPSRDRVTALRLPGTALAGPIPPGTLGNLTSLRTLSLRLNTLTAPLPPDLANCLDLRSLQLQGNRFSGEIPPFLFRMDNLIRLNLAGNNFSGGISPDFGRLFRLRSLYLEQNQLTGEIPGELNFTELEVFNVSYNRLNGSIPDGFRSMPASGFVGNSLTGCPLDACPTQGNPTPGNPTQGNNTDSGSSDDKLSGGAIAGIVIGSLFGLILLIIILFFLCHKKKSGDDASKNVHAATAKTPQGENVGGGVGKAAVDGGKNKLVFFNNATRLFDVEDLLRASAEVLGNGTFGTAYKAILDSNYIVAVKRLKDAAIPEQEFRKKIEVVGAMNHKNLVPLRAYYYSKEEKLLVCDYMHKGSLSALLHGNRGAGRTPLNWETRSVIALGAARGIEYLHSQGPTISHGNIKSSNILLTNSYEACVSDFGLAHLVGPSSNPNRLTGYRAPEVTDGRNVSHKADVFSFGVLLLEMLTGKAPSHTASNNDEGIDLPRWVQSVVREEWTSEVFDQELLRYQNVEEDMVQLLQLAVDCVAQHPDKRPSMSEVAQRIDGLCRPSTGKDNGTPRDLYDDFYDSS